MKKLLLLLPFLLMLVSCEEQQYSELKWEKAKCMQLSYVPQNIIRGGLQPGMNWDGDLVIHVVPDQVTPEQWCVVLKCLNHGKTFAFDNKDLYQNITPGQLLELGYVEEYMVDVKKNTKRFIDYHTREIKVNTNIIRR